MKINIKALNSLFAVVLTSTAFSVSASPSTGYFIYDESGHLIGEYDQNGHMVQEHIYLNDRPVAVATTSGMNYVTTDQLNTPRVVTDSSQTTLWAWNSDPFGNGQPTGSLTYNLRFPGQYYDAETGHNYNYYRDYDPGTGRYVESDPIGLLGGVNTYKYTKGNPVTHYDPLGLFCISLGSDTTDWTETARHDVSYTLSGVVFAEATGAAGSCLWVRSVLVDRTRKVRDREICYSCAVLPCGNESCGVSMHFGDWQTENQTTTETSRETSWAFRIYTGNDFEAGDSWFCSNPWTGRGVGGAMSSGP